MMKLYKALAKSLAFTLSLAIAFKATKDFVDNYIGIIVVSEYGPPKPPQADQSRTNDARLYDQLVDEFQDDRKDLIKKYPDDQCRLLDMAWDYYKTITNTLERPDNFAQEWYRQFIRELEVSIDIAM